jgi:hypothetical protein
MSYFDYQVHVMGHVPYVGFVTRSRATVRTRFTFCIKKKKKKGSSQQNSVVEDRRLPEKQDFSQLLGGDQAVFKPHKESRYDLGDLLDDLSVVEQPCHYQ